MDGNGLSIQPWAEEWRVHMRSFQFLTKKHIKVGIEEDLEQTIIEKFDWVWFKMINFKGLDDWNHISTFPNKKITLSNIHLAIRREPLVAAEVAHINVQWLHQITPTVEAAVTGSWSHLQFTWHHGSCGKSAGFILIRAS